MGTGNATDRWGEVFDPPTLAACWRRAPYLHDGSDVTLQDELTGRDPEDKRGRASHLPAAEILELAAYVRSL